MGKDNYIQIKYWMRSTLGLAGSTLIAFAIIYNYHATGRDFDMRGLGILCNWTNKNRKSCVRLLNGMIRDGLIAQRLKSVDGEMIDSWYPIVNEYGKMDKDTQPTS